MGFPMEVCLVLSRDAEQTKIISDAETYRIPMAVREIHLFRHSGAYPVCPRCKLTIEREYQAYCDRCGQALGWEEYGEALIVLK